MLNPNTVAELLEELKWWEDRPQIQIEVYTVDGHFVTKKIFTKATKAKRFIEEEPEAGKHKLMLTLR